MDQRKAGTVVVAGGLVAVTLAVVLAVSAAAGRSTECALVRVSGVAREVCQRDAANYAPAIVLGVVAAVAVIVGIILLTTARSTPTD